MTAALAPPDAGPAAQARVRAALAPFVEHSLGTYGNFTNAVEPAVVQRMYAPQTRQRLQELKQQWDPGNLFSRNHNLAPSSSAGAILR